MPSTSPSLAAASRAMACSWSVSSPLMTMLTPEPMSADISILLADTLISQSISAV